MGIIFGKKKPVSRVTDQDRAVLQLKQQRDKLKQYQKRIEKNLASDRELARRLISNGQKDRAKLLLRKKRFQEQLLQKTDGQLENLERLSHDIEFAQVEMQVVDGLKNGNNALKKINDAMNIEDIEKILDETREGIEKQQEIDALLHGALTDEDEEAVLEELDELIGQSLPSVPKEVIAKPSEPNIIEEDEEEEEEEEETHEKEKPKIKEKRRAEKIAIEEAA